jgi:glycosyltransferase involved in cell wall biosynthesis
MNVWLINSSEVVPTDPGNGRLRRMGILADVLVSRGHNVVWWTSTFRHLLKIQRFSRNTTIDVTDRLRLRFLRVPAYYKNISVSRLWNHHLLGRTFRRLAPTEVRPDVILCSFPTVELSDEAVQYGAKFGVPVVLDVRDMWPDIFLDLVPRWSRRLTRVALQPLFKAAERACRGAFAVSGHVPGFVDWGLRRGQRQRTRFDRDFPFAYAVPDFDEATLAEARQFWQGHGVPARPNTFVVCFLGAVSHQFDLATVILAARRLAPQHDIQFVLAGAGVRTDAYRELAADCPNVVVPGWVTEPQVQSLLRMSRLGLAPYVSRRDFEVSIPNKAIEYFSAGLPVLTSLRRGVLLELLREHKCGATYDNDGQLAEIIRSYCGLPRELEAMSQNALGLFADRFTAPKVYGAMADYLEGVAEAGRLPPRPTVATE